MAKVIPELQHIFESISNQSTDTVNWRDNPMGKDKWTYYRERVEG